MLVIVAWFATAERRHDIRLILVNDARFLLSIDGQVVRTDESPAVELMLLLHLSDDDPRPFQLRLCERTGDPNVPFIVRINSISVGTTPVAMRAPDKSPR